MRIRTALPAVAVVAAAAALAGCSDSTHGDQQTLKLTEAGGNQEGGGPIGNATNKSTPPGSGFAFYTPLKDSSGKAVGELDAFCIATQPSPEQAVNGQCSGTVTAPGGTLALDVGGKNISNNITGAIVGGTGKYAGATGTFTSTGGENSTDTFNITLP
jgi:hypothetical protein